MNELQVFSNPEFGQLRTVMIDNEPWAVGKDVATALGYKNPSKAVKDHVDDEDARTEILPYSQNGKTVGKLNIVNESGLYSLILSSKLPSAKQFKRWVTSEVLPELRRTGSYTVQKGQTRVLTPDDYIRAASIVSTCRNERMPYVIDLLKQSGIEITFHVNSNPNKDIDGDAARMINRAVNEYGMKIRQIARLTGLQPTQVTRIRSGESVPQTARAKIICDTLTAEFKSIDNDKE